MTIGYLQNLSHVDLIEIAIRLRILPHNFCELRLAHNHGALSKILLNPEEYQDLINEVYDIFTEQHSESLNDLNSPLTASLHKFEIERDGASGLTQPLPDNYFTDQLGVTKNKLHLILRDMEWAVIFWQLSTNIQKLIEQEEKHFKEEESNLSITVHESPIMPRFGRQSNPEAFRSNGNSDYYIFSGNLQADDIKTESYFFSISKQEYKRYIFLKNDYNYYWAELYHYNKDYQRKILLARSAILYKPKLLEVPEDSSKACKLFELSNGSPERLKSYISELSKIA